MFVMTCLCSDIALPSCSARPFFNPIIFVFSFISYFFVFVFAFFPPFRRSLMEQLRRLQALVMNTSNKPAQTGTCVLVRTLCICAKWINKPPGLSFKKSPSHQTKQQQLLTAALATDRGLSVYTMEETSQKGTVPIKNRGHLLPLIKRKTQGNMSGPPCSTVKLLTLQSEKEHISQQPYKISNFLWLECSKNYIFSIYSYHPFSDSLFLCVPHLLLFNHHILRCFCCPSPSSCSPAWSPSPTPRLAKETSVQWEVSIPQRWIDVCARPAI